jgi:cytochrome b561
MTDNHPRYSMVAIALHWAIAALILLNIATGFVMEGLRPPLKAVLVPFHVSCGITVLALSALKHLWLDGHAELARMGIGRR